jgi:hypothetical protein
MYLRAWADDDDFVGVFDVKSGDKRHLHINHVAVRKDANTFEMIDIGPSDEWEDFISSIEGLAAPILKSIIAGANWPLNEEDRGILANFIALQLARAPWLRDTMNETSTQVMRTVERMIASLPDDSLRAHVEDALDGEELSDDELQELRQQMSRGDVVVTHHNNDTIEFFRGAAELVQPIADMTWTLIQSDEIDFITSDQPIVSWPHPGQPEWMTPGPLTAAFTTFPISPRLVIRLEFLISDDDPSKLISARDPARKASSAEVAEINKQTYRHADRHAVFVWDATKFS